MAKKSMKEAATAGTSIFDTIATGEPRGKDFSELIQKDPEEAMREMGILEGKAVDNVLNAKGVKNAKDVQDVQNAKRKLKEAAITQERLNLRIPSDIKQYLYEAAYRESSPTKQVSVTEYLCQLVRDDMKKHKGK